MIFKYTSKSTWKRCEPIPRENGLFMIFQIIIDNLNTHDIAFRRLVEERNSALAGGNGYSEYKQAWFKLSGLIAGDHGQEGRGFRCPSREQH
jgi:hypothetical protein